MRLRQGLLASTLVLLALAPAAASVEEPERLVARRGVPTVEPRPGVLREQPLGLRPEALAAPGEERAATTEVETVRLDLFDDEPLVLMRTRGGSLARGGHSWEGRPLDGGPGHAAFVVRGDKVYGSVRRPGSNLQIRPDPAGGHRVEELDEAAWPDDAQDFETVWSPEGAAPEASPRAPVPAGATSELIDVLVVYTEAARVGAGGLQAIQALIDLAEVETNASYANAGIDQRIRIVHSEELVYAETGDSGLDLSRIRGTTDGFLDDVHAVRDAYGADVVSLWLDDTGGCGRGYLMGVVSSGFASSAFNVCKVSCATGNLTFGHELGHNMGLRHDWYVDDTSGSPYTYNHGYAYPAGGWRTVMAYNDRCADAMTSCTRLQRFSNPAESEGGVPTGVATPGPTNCVEDVVPAAECEADNRTALAGTESTVAGFRATQVLVELAKEVDLASAVAGDTLTYTLTVTNTSLATAAAIEIRDTVPANTALVAGSLSGDASAAGTSPGSLITWITGQSLAPGASLMRTFEVTATSGGFADNTATVDSSDTSLTVSSNTVRTTIWESVACGFQDGFESGDLGHRWRVVTTADGRARALPDLPDSGAYSAVLDDAVPDGTTSIAAMDLAADLAGQTDVTLSFRWTEAGDEEDAADGVFIRQAEGDPWVSAMPFTDVDDLVFQDAALDLDQAAANAGLTLVDGFQVRFQFSDNYSFNPTNLAGSDGYVIDNVALSCACSLELTGARVSTTVVHDTPCVIYAGPSYEVEDGGDLTLSSSQAVVLRNGFSVLQNGSLRADNDP